MSEEASTLGSRNAAAWTVAVPGAGGAHVLPLRPDASLKPADTGRAGEWSGSGELPCFDVPIEDLPGRVLHTPYEGGRHRFACGPRPTMRRASSLSPSSAWDGARNLPSWPVSRLRLIRIKVRAVARHDTSSVPAAIAATCLIDDPQYSSPGSTTADVPANRQVRRQHRAM